MNVGSDCCRCVHERTPIWCCCHFISQCTHVYLSMSCRMCYMQVNSNRTSKRKKERYKESEYAGEKLGNLRIACEQWEND